MTTIHKRAFPIARDLLCRPTADLVTIGDADWHLLLLAADLAGRRLPTGPGCLRARVLDQNDPHTGCLQSGYYAHNRRP